jgi:c-di-GMP-binding flagellar brake protein YcgR
MSYTTPPREAVMHDRRFGYRIPLEVMFTSYVRDRPVRALSADLSDSGLGLATVAGLAPPPGSVVGVELELPGVADSIWLRGEITHTRPGSLASGLGLRFVAMARAHARTLRDFVVESRRSHLGGLLARIRPASAG